MSLNNSKVHYKHVMKDQIINLPEFTLIGVSYTLFPQTRRLTDLGNVLSVHQKYFEDALVEYGKLPDDNYKFLIENHQYFGEVDKYNPRVEIVIEDLS